MTRQTTSELSSVGKQIEAVRTQRHIPLTKLAPLAKLNYSQLYRIMHGTSKASRDSLLRICRALSCSSREASEIFAHTDYRAPTDSELTDEDEPQRAA